VPRGDACNPGGCQCCQLYSTALAVYGTALAEQFFISVFACVCSWVPRRMQHRLRPHRRSSTLSRRHPCMHSASFWWVAPTAEVRPLH
jgi:hypothetical protein